VGAAARLFGARFYKLEKHTCASAAGGGHLLVLQWLREQDCPWGSIVGGDNTCCASAAEGGHLEVLQWVREHGCPWDASTCAGAARGGHLEVLQWAREQEPPCPWDWQTCENAWKSGHLAVLRWARENGCEEYVYPVRPGRNCSKYSSFVNSRLSVCSYIELVFCSICPYPHTYAVRPPLP